jgi:hypothetical protein
MQGHKQDDYDGGRAASLTTEPPASESKPAKKPLDPDELALALALLALTDGGDP